MKNYNSIPNQEDIKYLDYIHKLSKKESENVNKLKKEILEEDKES